MENWERRVQPLMKQERRGPPLRGVTHQVLEVPVSLCEKCGGIVTSYFVNTGFKKKKKAVLETFLRRESHYIQSFKGKCFFFFFEWWIICCCLFFDTTWNSRILSTGCFDCLGCQVNVPRRGVLFISYYTQHTKWQLGSPRCALNMPLTFKIISVLIFFFQ